MELVSERVLLHFDPKLPSCLYCDASNYWIGDVLLHEIPDGSNQPISYASRTLNDVERNYSTIHKKALLALFWGMNKNVISTCWEVL